MDLFEEGIQHAMGASESFEWLGDTAGSRERCLIVLAYVLLDDKQPGAAEEAASIAIHLLPEEGEQLLASGSRSILGDYTTPNATRRKPFAKLRGSSRDCIAS